MDPKAFEPVMDAQDKVWTAPKFITLLVVTLGTALVIIYAAATIVEG